MNFARPPSSKADMTHETPQNRSFFASYLVAYLTTQICWRLSCWSWVPGTGWGGMLVVTGDAMVTTQFVKSGCFAWFRTGNPRECKKPDVSICLHKYTRIIIYIYILEIWYFFEFIVFVQWFLYCWIKDSWTPHDQEVSVASLTLPDNLMRRLMRTGTVKGGELMTSGVKWKRSHRETLPVRWWLSIGTLNDLRFQICGGWNLNMLPTWKWELSIQHAAGEMATLRPQMSKWYFPLGIVICQDLSWGSQDLSGFHEQLSKVVPFSILLNT